MSDRECWYLAPKHIKAANLVNFGGGTLLRPDLKPIFVLVPTKKRKPKVIKIVKRYCLLHAVEIIDVPDTKPVVDEVICHKPKEQKIWKYLLDTNGSLYLPSANLDKCLQILRLDRIKSLVLKYKKGFWTAHG